MKKIISFLAVTSLSVLILTACSSSPDVNTQKYAKHRSERDFEYDFPQVWKGLEAALKKHKITDRDPEKVTPSELKKLSERTLETDWIFGESRDKYVEYKVNGFPRKKYLKTRWKYNVKVMKKFNATNVAIEIDEQIEDVDNNGVGTGYSTSEAADTSRANDVLDEIQRSILAAG